MLKNEKILKFLGKKIVRFLILLIFVILLSFLLIDMSPINPVKSYIANLGSVSPEKIAALEARLEESTNYNQQLRQELKTVSDFLGKNFGFVLYL